MIDWRLAESREEASRSVEVEEIMDEVAESRIELK